MSSNNFKIYIVEDEIDVQNTLKKALLATNQVEIVGFAEDIVTAFKGIVHHDLDVIYLDIKLKGGDAFQLLDKLQENHIDYPPIIMMTGYTEFEYAQKALNKYSHKIIKILQKPFWEKFDQHFEECKDAIITYQRSKLQIPSQDIFNLKVGSITYRIKMEEIDYIEVGGGGTIIIVKNDRTNVQVNQTLKQFLQSSPSKILRIHRNNAVNIDKISYINHEDRLIYLKGHARGLVIGRAYYPSILNLLH